MSLYAIKNDEGKYWDEVEERWTTTPCDGWESKESADEAASERHSHVVELIEKPAPVVVSQEEAKILSIKDTSKLLREIDVYANFLDTCGKPHPETVMRLMRACVVGWVVAKPKRYLVRVPHANRHYYYQKCDSGEVIPICDMEKEPPTQFTDAEIEHYGLQDCEKVEAKQHDE